MSIQRIPALGKIVISVVTTVILITLFAICYSMWGPTGCTFPWLAEHTTSVRVLVKDSSGKPVEGCTGNVTPEKNRTPRTPIAYVTNKNGEFTVHNLPLGNATVHISCSTSSSLNNSTTAKIDKPIKPITESLTKPIRLTAKNSAESITITIQKQ